MRPARTSLARGRDLIIDQALYRRYLETRVGRGLVAELCFDLCLARACARRGLARDAIQTARARASSEPAERRAAAASAELHRLRVDALVKAARKPDETKLRALFDERFGVDGQKVRIRQILLSRVAVERALEAAGESTDEKSLEAALEHRAETVHRALVEEGKPFAAMLGLSDDPTTRTLLADPRNRALAGIVDGYNYQRYGSDFAAAVRALEVGAVSAPIRTSHGIHIVELLARETTNYADVRAGLERDWLASQATAPEELALRDRLFASYEVRVAK